MPIENSLNCIRFGDRDVAGFVWRLNCPPLLRAKIEADANSRAMDVSDWSITYDTCCEDCGDILEALAAPIVPG